MKENILSLIKETSTKLPKDVERALKKAYENEDAGSGAKSVLGDIIENIRIAKRDCLPICQDTGTVNFFVTHYIEVPQKYIENEAIKAVKSAVREGYLRPNSVDSITGKNTGNGVGEGNPKIYFTQSGSNNVNMQLLLKGGGSENVSAQYSLPDSALGAYRDVDGVRRCVIDAVFRAQGKGCAPGIIGVGIGGDRTSSYEIAKKQLLRRLDDVNKVKELSDLENELYCALNSLGIGPMGAGGKTTVLGVKVGALCRVPASFFVSVAYMCWALRRGSMTIRPNLGMFYE